MARRKVGNPLALVVLCLLLERPMHPYEMAFTARMRRIDESIKLNYGSLYTVVDSLLRAGLIAVREVVREGRRPERTVYGLTPDGRRELNNWMTELLGTPVKEYPRFATALSLVGVMPKDTVIRLLERRVAQLERENEETRFTLEAVLSDEPASGEPVLERLFVIEGEYQLALKEAEVAFVRRVIDDLRSGTLNWPVSQEAFHPGIPDDAPEPARTLSGDDEEEHDDEDEEESVP